MTVWVSMLHLSRCWVLGVDSKLEPKFKAEFESRVKTSSYEAACWGALAKCGLTQQADHLKALVRQLETRDIGGGALEINLGSDGAKLLAPGTAAKETQAPDPRASQSPGKPESRPRAPRTPERRAGSPAPSGVPLAPTTARTPAPPPRPQAVASTALPRKTSPSLLDRMREQARRKLQAQSRSRAG